MKKIIYLSIIAVTFLTLSGCGIYSFTGGSTGDAKTVQIDFFKNEAPLVEPRVSPKFTDDLRDLFTRQTNLALTNSDGDLKFEGEIVGYRTSPTTATADQKASQTRLTVTVNVRFTNTLKEEDDFEKQFSHFYDFDANENPEGPLLETMLGVIFTRITEDIFNASVNNW